MKTKNLKQMRTNIVGKSLILNYDKNPVLLEINYLLLNLIAFK